MSNLRSIPFALLGAGLLAASGASAQSMYSIDQRQDYQQDRIERGIRDGQITRSEAYRLEQGERRIDRAQARARADGMVTPQERARIDHMADRQGREIYRQSHDPQQAWDRGQNWGRTDGRYDGWRDNGGRQNASGRDGWGRGGSGQNHGWNGEGDRGNHYGWNRGEHNGWDGNRPPGIERRDDRHGMMADRHMTTPHDGMFGQGDANRPDRRAHSGQPQTSSTMRNGWSGRGPSSSQQTANSTAHNGWSGRGPSYSQQTANSHAGSNAWANGGTRGQAQVQTRPQFQAPTTRQAAFNPSSSARMMPAATPMPRATTQNQTMNTGGRSSGGRRR